MVTRPSYVYRFTIELKRTNTRKRFFLTNAH